MNSRFLKIIFSFVLCLSSSGILATNFEVIDGLKYLLDTETNTATLVANSENPYSGVIKVPEEVISSAGLKYPVTYCAENCFLNCEALTQVMLPSSVVKLGEHCFQNCKKLQSVELPLTITMLPDYCFTNCSQLSQIKIPQSVISLGEWCFDGCNELEKVEIPKSVICIGDFCFWGCPFRSIIIPEGVKGLGDRVFIACHNLEKITLPNTLETIGGWCFADCENLCSVSLPESLISLGYGSFSGCEKLSEIIIPASVQKIDDGCFASCSKMESIKFKGNTPPTIKGSPFSQVQILYVPNQALDTYKTAWGNAYKYIIGWNPTENEDVVKPCSTPSITYTSGSLSFESSTPGAEYHYTIKDADVATDKYNTDGKVKLNGKLDISVYATADGYKASDKATATLYWLNAEGGDDTNNINLVKTRGVMVTTDSDITISGLNDGEMVTFYSVNGVNLGSAKAVQGVLHFAKPNESLVIAKIKGNDLKIAIK